MKSELKQSRFVRVLLRVRSKNEVGVSDVNNLEGVWRFDDEEIIIPEQSLSPLPVRLVDDDRHIFIRRINSIYIKVMMV